MSAVRWVVGPGDGGTIGEVLARVADPRALAEGRVFVGRRRVRSDGEPVRPGDVVEIAPARSAPPKIAVLARARDWVAVDKPAGIPTIPDHAGSAHSLVAAVARALKLDPATVHATSRLDRDVSGVVVFALSRGAIERLIEARKTGTYGRRYVAIASKAPEPVKGTWTAAIGRASSARLRAVGGRDAVPAATGYATTAVTASGYAAMAVAPVTGRTHQIRVHAAHAGAPLVGDGSYGGAVRIVLRDGRVLQPRRIALHAARVVVPGADGTPWEAIAPIPSDLRDLWTALGGDGAAWELSATCSVPSL